MKCRHCGSEWQANQRLSVSLKNCPFCGQSLEHKEPKKLDTLEAVVASIYQQFGEEALRDGKKMISFFFDLAPDMQKERKLLRYLVDCNGHVLLLDAKKTNAPDAQMRLEKIVYQMTEELFLAEKPSRQVCEQYWAAIGGSPFSKRTSVQPIEDVDIKSASESQNKLDASGYRAEQEKNLGTAPKSQTAASSAVKWGTDFQVEGRTLIKYLGTSPNPCVPDGIRTIGEKAFYPNKKIQSVTLPDTVTKIKKYAFAFCENLHTIHMSSRLEVIEGSAFYGSGLKNVSLPESLASMAQGAFKETKIEKIRIPPKVAEVPYGAFSRCPYLREVVLCNGVEKIAENSFSHCPGLKTITIPDTLMQFSGSSRYSNVFCGTDNITTVIASNAWKEKNRHFLQEMIPSKNETENFEIKNNVLVHYYGRSSCPVIPPFVTEIGSSAFDCNTHILSVTIPEGVKKISRSAFFNCKNLQAVYLPQSLEVIEPYAFCCSKLTSVVIPKNVHTVGDNTFGSCHELREVTIPEGLTNISNSAFEWSDKIQTIHASTAWTLRNSELIKKTIKKK